MRAIYSCCIIDPFLEVAKKLEREKGLKPIYWIGDIASAEYKDEEENELKSAFPGIVYQPYIDAWHGVFPKESEGESNVELNFLQSFSCEELQALSMMDRLDYDRHSFNYMERESFFLKLVKRWSFIIDTYRPDIVISAVNPHRVFDYVLYLLCKYNNIKFVSFQWTMSSGRLFLLNYFDERDSMNKLIDGIYSKKTGTTIEQLPKDIKENYLKINADYEIAKPSYMAVHDKDDVLNRKMFFLFKRYMRVHSVFGSNSLFRGQSLTIYKNANHRIEDSRFSILEWYNKRKATFKYNKNLQEYYNSCATSVSLNERYIVFFLHYQPEETTSPNGGIFANQSLCIETLLRNTPQDVKIYVKEHPNQFMSHMQGHTKRIKEFYDGLLSNPRVSLVPFEVNSFSLISNAIAVSTVTGTVGWEAAVRKKPVIIFGSIWYERMKGIIRIFDDESASKIKEFIDNYEYDEQAIVDYLNAFAKVSFIAYHYKGYKDSTGITEEETINNICNALTEFIQ